MGTIGFYKYATDIGNHEADIYEVSTDVCVDD